MATRRAVAASIASAVIFSSMLISNFVLFSGSVQNFRLLSLAAEEREYFDQALMIRSAALLDLLIGAQDMLSTRQFTCSSASFAVGHLLSTERVEIGGGGLSADASLSSAPDETVADNMTALRPFNGATAGLTNIEASSVVKGKSPDGDVVYDKTEGHLLSLPLRLGALTGDCLLAYAQVSSALGALGTQLCNSSVLAQTMASLVPVVSMHAGSDGFSVSVTYAVISTQPCQVGFWISAYQENVLGPDGAFRFSEEEPGLAVG